MRRVTCFRSRGCCHPITPHSIPAIFGMRSARSGILCDLLRKPITTYPTKWLTDFPLLPNRKILTSTANRNGTSIHQNPISKFSNKLKYAFQVRTPASEPSYEIKKEVAQDYSLYEKIIASLNLTENMRIALECRQNGLSYPEIGRVLSRAQATVYEYFIKMRQRYMAIYG